MSYVPREVLKPTKNDRLEGLHRNEIPSVCTLRRLERKGLLLPDNIVHKYVPERKPPKRH